MRHTGNDDHGVWDNTPSVAPSKAPRPTVDLHAGDVKRKRLISALKGWLFIVLWIVVWGILLWFLYWILK